MFFCEEKEARKRAKRVVDEGGLLERLPGFRTGHQARQPNVGTLVQPAAQDGEGGSNMKTSSMHTDVYFDPSRMVQALAMPIFVRQSNGSWRRATAYSVTKDDQQLLMSVAHIFAESDQKHESALENDSEFDFGSDSDSAQSDADPVKASPAVEGVTLNVRNKMINYQFGGAQVHDKPDSFDVLGTVLHSSIDQDWAIVTITHAGTLAQLKDDQSIPSDSYFAERIQNATVIICKAVISGSTFGKMSTDTTYIRLAGSRTFQKVYTMVPDFPVDCGDCGSLVMDADSHEVYGHIVASSDDRRIVFVMPASSIARSSGTRLRALESDPPDAMEADLGDVRQGGRPDAKHSVRSVEMALAAPEAARLRHLTKSPRDRIIAR